MTQIEKDLDYCAGKLPEKFYGASIFVTGATGLIGSLIVKTLLTANKNYSANIRIFAMVRNVDKANNIYGTDESINFVVGDIQNSITCTEKIDYIIHTASQTASKEMVTHPVATSKVSLLGTLNVLDFAVQKHTKGVVYLSSMEAFGSCNNPNDRLSETSLGNIDLTNIRNCYSESKRMCELLVKSYSEEYGLNVCSARLAQVFGAGIFQSENRVFAQFARSALANQNIVLHTDGTSWGNYCYTTDAICAIFTILEKGVTGETYTVVNEETSIMIKDMAQLVIDVAKSTTAKVVFDIPETNSYGYAPKTVMKLSSLKLNQLGWKPEIDLKTMYQRLITHLRESAVK